MGLRRREFLTAAGLAALHAQPRRPNILFLLLDDLGYADVGCYGQKKIRTPNIDRLAREGTRFTAAYAGGPVCAPSRCVLMTGKHGGHARIRANAGTAPMGPGDHTFPAWLREQGYVCGGFGKWGLGDAGSSGVPWKHGFHRFFGYLHQVHAHSYWPEFLWDNSTKVPLGKKVYSADLIAEKSFAFLKENRTRPFFLYATYTVPHAHYEPPGTEPYAGEDWPEVEKKYAAMVTRGDDYAGRLLRMLDGFGLTENTLVIFASDNGGVGGESHKLEFFDTMQAGNGVKFRGQKGTLFEGGLRVPFVIRWPGRVKPGQTSGTPVYFTDVFATLKHAVTGRAERVEDGEPILALLEGRKRASPMVWESHRWSQQTRQLGPNFGMAVRDGNWKAIRPAPGAALELYDLEKDPGETSNLANTQPAVAARMERFMQHEHTPPAVHDGDMKFVE